MRIGIANDVRIAAEMIRRVVARTGRHEIAWVAEDGREALEKCAQDPPDLVLMDLIMPNMDGVEATRKIMEERPCPILVVTASVEQNAKMVFEALHHGALDAVPTPVLGGTGTSSTARGLVEKIEAIEQSLKSDEAAPESPAATHVGEHPIGRDHLVCIGVSSSGAKALSSVLDGLDPAFPAGIVVIQHLDTDFAGGLAGWLDERLPLEVRAAQAGDEPRPGVVLVPASVEHLVLTGDGRLAYATEPKSGPRPSIDVFFKSVAYRWKGTGTAILLQGMGRDGVEGLLALREKGFHTIAQAQATGMPKAAADAGAALEVLSLPQIALALQPQAR